MAVEMGAKCGLMEADQKTLAWLKQHSKKKAQPVNADKNAKYEKVIEMDISKLKPQVAKPHAVDNVSDASTLKNKKIDEVFIGTCTNGRLEDLEIAAKTAALSGKIVDGTPFTGQSVSELEAQLTG